MHCARDDVTGSSSGIRLQLLRDCLAQTHLGAGIMPLVFQCMGSVFMSLDVCPALLRLRDVIGLRACEGGLRSSPDLTHGGC